MRVLLLGATGFIGSAILREFLAAGHGVVALARTASAAERPGRAGAEVVRGDLREPERWAAIVRDVDAVIHAAATFTADMGEVDRAAVRSLIENAMGADRRIRFIYTGGVWLYGETGDSIATEETPFAPIAAFDWMVRNSAEVLSAPCFEANVVHPGICYVRDGGAFSRLLPERGRIVVWGSLQTRWPLVHRDDLARAYRLVLEHGAAGASYNVCAEEGVQVGDVVAAIAKRHAIRTPPLERPLEQVVKEHGAWAVGPTLDQRMSSRRIRETLGWMPAHTDAVAEMS
ncbi:NAD-dependent epimerase/dehydratase family protein [Lentisalinibacter orientalis]|uniref:NAD-dependent epimerase/dehydratase family protein n=1 Tax=Lentisalinibacter orientalis TaxID=2992241 RepID=UPI003865D741